MRIDLSDDLPVGLPVGSRTILRVVVFAALAFALAAGGDPAQK